MRNDDLDPACRKTSLAHRLGRQAGDRGLFLPLMPIVPSVGGSKMASGAEHHPFGLEGRAAVPLAEAEDPAGGQRLIRRSAAAGT